VFRNFREAANEIQRDLNELGVDVFAGYQSVDYTTLSTDQANGLVTKELRNYDYRVLQPSLADLTIPSPEWFDQEWVERQMGIEGDPVNPGHSWSYRRDLWVPLLEGYQDELHPGEFAYTYSERLGRQGQVFRAIDALVSMPHTRQAIVSIWDPTLDILRLGKRRVPCSLYYQFFLRDGELDTVYAMRSNDFGTHWANDVGMAMKLAAFVVAHVNERAGMKYRLGSLTQMVGSLHVYKADVQHVF